MRLASGHLGEASSVAVEAVSITTVLVRVGVLPEGSIRPACLVRQSYPNKKTQYVTTSVAV
jgi:hypothetical protein